MLVMQIDTITKGTCLIKGYEKFFPIDSLSLGAESSIDDEREKGAKGSGGPSRDFVVKKNDPEEVEFERKVDGVTPYLMTQTIRSRTAGSSLFCTIDASFSQMRGDEGGKTDLKAYCMIRFGKARLISWSLSGDSESARPTETVTFKYSQIALYVRTTDDGINYLAEEYQSWDFEANKECPQLIPSTWKVQNSRA